MASKIRSFTSNDNPAKDTLYSVDPTVLTLLPDNYEGENTSSHLASAFVHAINKTGSYTALNTTDVAEIPDDMRRGNGRLFADAYARFIKNENDYSIYYDLLNVFDTPKLTSEQIFYGITLIQAYGGTRTRNGILNTLHGIYRYKKENMQSTTELVELDQLENLFALSSVLRKEGVQIPISSLWVCSTHWTADEVIHLIAEGLEIRKAVELYGMGFTTMDEILNYGTTIPDSWLDRIINGPPKKKAQTN